MSLKVFAIIFCVSSVYGARFNLNNGNHPVKWYDTTNQNGQYNRERIAEIYAEILPQHVRSNGRVNFPTSGEFDRKYQQIKADGDERGHLIASQFSGPPEWWNLSPQNARVNRNKDYQSITTDWYNSECEARSFLNQGGNRMVKWDVKMQYVGNSNRPDKYELSVKFLNNGREAKNGIYTKISNPFKKQDSTFWVCRKCGSNRCSRA